jgi:hypothetical protein
MTVRNDGNRARVFGRRRITPMHDHVPARGINERFVGATDRFDSNHMSAIVDRQAER